MIIIKGQVLTILNGNMFVLLNGNKINCEIRGVLKKNNKILVGDYVEVESLNNNYIITKILPRKNQLIRPAIANLDQLFIVLAKKPKPDFLLIDKLLIYCDLNKIEPFIVINKKDLFSESEINDICNQYEKVVKKIIITSAKNGDTNILLSLLKNKLSAFAGQSAVGKSTLINSLFPNLKLETNVLSRKIERGKHTTRHNEIFVENDIKLTDTPGFSMLDLNIEPIDLKNFYTEFNDYSKDCFFKDCVHVNCDSKYCGVVKAIENNMLNKNRYNRYVELYNKVKENWEKKYD